MMWAGGRFLFKGVKIWEKKPRRVPPQSISILSMPSDSCSTAWTTSHQGVLKVPSIQQILKAFFFLSNPKKWCILQVTQKSISIPLKTNWVLWNYWGRFERYALVQRDNLSIQCRSKTQALVDCKATLLSKTEILDSKKNLLEETNAEKQKLQRERKLLREMLQNITKDLNAVNWLGTVL